MLNSNIWNSLTVCKQITSSSFKNATYKLIVYKYIRKYYLALNNLQWLIYHNTQPNTQLFNLDLL